MSLKKLLQSPYPLVLNKWKTTVSVSLFIAFFLSVFQPFGLQFVQIDHKSIILAAYGLVTLVILLLNLFVLPMIFKPFFREEKWVVWKQLVLLTCIVLSISLGNYWYSIYFSIVHWVGIQGFLLFILFTLLIALIPIIIITFITQNIHLKRNLKLSGRINDNISHKDAIPKESPIVVLSSGTQSIKIQLDHIVFLESEGNYVNVNYVKDGILYTELIRNTLKDIYADITEDTLFKCHRAFVINLAYVEKVKGNSHGISVHLKHTDKQIPVSRNNTKAFTERLGQLVA